MKRARSIRLQPKLLLGLVAMAAVLAAILAPSIAQLYRARMEEQYASLAFGQASVAADLIDGDRVEQYYRTGEKDAYYEEIHRYLQDVREKLGLKYFYVVVPEDEVMYSSGTRAFPVRTASATSATPTPTTAAATS